MPQQFPYRSTEILLKQNPAVIGTGIPMFDGPFQPQLFRPTDLRQLDSGVRILSFDRR